MMVKIYKFCSKFEKKSSAMPGRLAGRTEFGI
jgi:hypothetical protein